MELQTLLTSKILPNEHSYLKKIICAYFNYEEYIADDALYVTAKYYFMTALNSDMLYYLKECENYNWKSRDLTKKDLDPYDQTKFLWEQMTINQKLEFYEKTK